MELVEFKVWGVTSLPAAERETKPSSTSFLFLRELVYPYSLPRTFINPHFLRSFSIVSHFPNWHIRTAHVYGVPCSVFIHVFILSSHKEAWNGSPGVT